MAVDTPARIAVIGAGPIGLEAALYARYLGYDVDIYERGRIAENLLRWGHARLFTPWKMNVSPLGLAALSAQDEDWGPPNDEAMLTGQELAEAYFIPLANSDLLVDHLHLGVEVSALGREGLLKTDIVEADTRINAPFRMLVLDGSGAERVATADVVIDASGTYGNHNWAGQAGIPALGECGAAGRIEYGLPDILGSEREQYAGRLTLLFGSGYSAATSAVAIAELAESVPGTRLTWVVRNASEAEAGPIRLISEDRLPERERLAQAANALARSAREGIIFWPGTSLDKIEATGDRLQATLTGRHAGSVEVDRVIANVGYRPDTRIYSELQVHECYVSSGPMKLAAALARNLSADCLDQAAHGPETLFNPEPDFYILGAKSYGRNSQFLLSVGREQIRDLFSIIGDRADLDLYATARKLHP